MSKLPHFFVEDDVMAQQQIESKKYVELEFAISLIKKSIECKMPVTANNIIRELKKYAIQK